MRWQAPAVAMLMVSTAAGCAAADDRRDAFTAELAGRFRSAYPALAVKVTEPLTLVLGDEDQTLTANLDRIYQVCQSNDPQICAAAKTDFVDGIAQHVAAMKNPDLDAPRRENLRLLVRAAGACAEIDRAMQDAGSPARLIFEPLTADTCVTMMFDFPRSRRTTTPADLETLGLTREAAWSLAKAQVLSHLPKLATVELKPDTLHVFADLPDSTSLVLDTAGWSALAAKHSGKRILVTIPDENFLTVMITGRDGIVDGLRKSAQESYDVAQRGISPAVLEWRNAGWQIVP
jgi:hypothetical protein